MRIQDVVRRGRVVTTRPDAGVADLVALLTEHGIGAVVVLDGGGGLAGIASERDVVRRLAAGSAADEVPLLERPVEAIMTAVVHTCALQDTTADVMRVMTEHRVRHVPVLEDGALVGIVSIGDVVKARLDELAFERDQLDAYVHQG
ncbi:CBS domain-containing protein [Nocardioides sp. ChNu-153]|uniref:CBS domain-containing protein n=1 Tax=unclassified Nocardioides TaxID=2615069 RepID=UPI0024075503|nr:MULTISPECIES: CBS domain-containing protein [unclassified Nocardioides]MDF9715415.1 CBS domain-containing protein [Nocardioides sp. ChNu-99]MDN7120578.1 CBS domain-containing protein [Nocardioides sp. ChNu-153]